ncbi:MAG: glycosyltransferase family 4 protein, partial [Sedimentisphaerales bacterium]|nr:glycosyltransferase family 4 protein [Sedimentisphaerales bacterium]
MRILFTQETDWIERNPGQQHHLAEMLSQRGHEVRVIDYEILWQNKGKKELFSKRKLFEKVSKIRKDAEVTVIRPGIIKLPIMKYISFLFSHRNEINRQIKEFKPDVIVSWGIINSYLAANAAKKNNIPFIYYWIDVLHLLIPNRLFRPLGKTMERKALLKADLVLNINDKLKDYVLSMGASA